MGLDGAIRQENIKVIQPGKKEVMLSLFANKHDCLRRKFKNMAYKPSENPR